VYSYPHLNTLSRAWVCVFGGVGMYVYVGTCEPIRKLQVSITNKNAYFETWHNKVQKLSKQLNTETIAQVDEAKQT
jgi:hypothetical protein